MDKSNVIETKKNGNNKMNKLFFMGAMVCALGMMTACGGRYSDRIVGKWDVQSVRHEIIDHTAGTHNDYTVSASDTTYAGYDFVEFNADGTTRWHLNDRYFHDGMYSDPYRNFIWSISNDILFIYYDCSEEPVWDFEIKELNHSTFVIERYYNTEHPEYSHHHIEGTDCYTLKRGE